MDLEEIVRAKLKKEEESRPRNDQADDHAKEEDNEMEEESE